MALARVRFYPRSFSNLIQLKIIRVTQDSIQVLLKEKKKRQEKKDTQKKTESLGLHDKIIIKNHIAVSIF